MSNSAKDIGAAFRAARDNKGWSRETLGKKIDLDFEAVKKIETGERVQQWLKLAKACEVMGVTPNDLLGFSNLQVESLESALRPILDHFGQDPDLADSIARILAEAVSAAQSVQDDGPTDLRYKMAGQLAAARSRS